MEVKKKAEFGCNGCNQNCWVNAGCRINRLGHN